MTFFRLPLLAALACVLPAADGGGPTQVPESAPRANLAADAEALLGSLERLDAAFPAGPLDAAELLARVRREDGVELADALTDRLAASVEWLPYRGALRGARGVLIEGRGNALDQALLLGEALRGTGAQARLARAELTEESAAALHAALRSRPEGEPAERSEIDEAVREQLARAAAALHVDLAGLERSVAANEVRAQRYLERVLPMAVTQANALAGLLAEGGIAPPESDLGATERAVLRDHWWVQSSTDGASWKDHDPLARRAGVALGVVPAATFELDELPAEEEHGLRVCVVAERAGPAGITSAVALEHAAPARAWVDGYARLEFVPVHANALAANAEGDERILLVAERETEWLPVWITIDAEGRETPTVASSIRTDGSLDEEPDFDPTATPTGRAAGALAQLGVTPDALDPTTRLTAVWLEFEVRVPHAATRVIRRELFDLLGGVRRAKGALDEASLPEETARARGLALMGSTRILPVACRSSTEHVARIGLRCQIENQRLIVAYGDAVQRGDESAFAALVEALRTPPLDLRLLAEQRATVGRHAERTFLGELDVFAAHVQPITSAEEGLVYATAIDVVANRIGVLAPRADQTSGEAAWRVRLEQGVLDTVLENVALEGLDFDRAAARATADPRTVQDNAALLMEHRAAATWTVLAPGSELAPTNDTLTRAAEALATGSAAILPGALDELSRMPSTAWWCVDVATGDTLGIGPRGWGQTQVERLMHQVKVAQTFISPTRRLGVSVFCRAMSGAAMIGYLGAGLASTGVAIGGIGEMLGGSLGSYVGVGLTYGAAWGALAQSGMVQILLGTMNARCQLSMLNRSSFSPPTGPNWASSGSAPTLFR